ncbi:MAG: carboxypeptidase-like regulatory domain-containing protein [Bacteroidota bacterium]
MKLFICSLICTLLSLNLWAQQSFDITGTVKDENGAALQSVTVFIDGSNKYTMTDVSGHYTFAAIQPGTYRVATSMVGRGSERLMVILSNKSVKADLVMKPKPIELNEVVIGTDSRRNEMLRIFTNKFLGVTENAQSCTIINPKIIEFTTNKGILLATTPDFLIIENKNLGYRIKYLLKVFRYDRAFNLTSYTGDCIFEDLPGSTRQKKKWIENRRAAYQGSFMHFLRSLYSGNTREQGFKCYAFIDSAKTPTVSDQLVDMSQYVTRIDSNFIRLAFTKKFKVTHNSTKALLVKAGSQLPEEITKLLGDTNKTGKSNDRITLLRPKSERERRLMTPASFRASHWDNDAGIVKLYLNFTIVDRNGNYLDYRSFLLEDLWSELQVGDRLPFTYQP